MFLKTVYRALKRAFSKINNFFPMQAKILIAIPILIMTIFVFVKAKSMLDGRNVPMTEIVISAFTN